MWLHGKNGKGLQRQRRCSDKGIYNLYLKGRFDCTAAAVVVYVITCQRCYKLYIGETIRRLSDPFGKHLRSVEGFKQNPRYQGGGFPVAEHFNLPEHNHVHDMRVSVVRQVKGGTATRQREERRLIFQLGTLAPGGLNIDFKFFHSSSKQRQRARAIFVKCINATARACVNSDARKL